MIKRKIPALEHRDGPRPSPTPLPNPSQTNPSAWPMFSYPTSKHKLRFSNSPCCLTTYLWFGGKRHSTGVNMCKQSLWLTKDIQCFHFPANAFIPQIKV